MVFFLRKLKVLHNAPTPVTGASRCLFIANYKPDYRRERTSQNGEGLKERALQRRGVPYRSRDHSPPAPSLRHRVGNTQLLTAAGRHPERAQNGRAPLPLGSPGLNASSSERPGGAGAVPPPSPQRGGRPPSPSAALLPLFPFRVAAQRTPRRRQLGGGGGGAGGHGGPR